MRVCVCGCVEPGPEVLGVSRVRACVDARACVCERPGVCEWMSGCVCECVPVGACSDLHLLDQLLQHLHGARHAERRVGTMSDFSVRCARYLSGFMPVGPGRARQIQP